MSDPYVAVEVMGVKKKTRFQKQVNSCVFDEVFYFNFDGIKKEQVSEWMSDDDDDDEGM